MKKTNKPEPLAEHLRLEGDRTRRREQLATVESEIAAVDAELAAVKDERELLMLKSVDDPAAEAALAALEARHLTATMAQGMRAAKADALRKALAALDDAIRRLDEDAERAALDGMQAERVVRALRVDAAAVTLKQELEGYMAHCALQHARAVAFGVPNLNRLVDTAPVMAAVLRVWEPLRRVEPVLCHKYNDALAGLVPTLWPGIAPKHHAPADWRPTSLNTDDAPSVATADTAHEEVDDATR